MKHELQERSPGICPPFCPDDIIALRGKPVSKHIHTDKPSSAPVEEWMYFSADTRAKEYYFFMNGRLIGWKASEI